MAENQNHKPAPPTGAKSVPINGTLGKVIYLVKELGLTTVLIGFICFLLVREMSEMRQDFKTQTDKLVEAVANNNEVISKNSQVMRDLVDEIRDMRRMTAQRP